MENDNMVATKKFNKGISDCRKRYPPRDEHPDYVEGYAEEYGIIIRALCRGAKESEVYK